MTVSESPRGPSASNKTMQFAHHASASSYHQTQIKTTNTAENTGRWTKEEHSEFLSGLESHGKEWKKIAEMIKTRTVVQIRTHAQKYFQKIAKAREAQGKSIPGDLVSTASNYKSSAAVALAGGVPRGSSRGLPRGGVGGGGVQMRVRASSTSSVASSSSESSSSSSGSSATSAPSRKAPKASAPANASRARPQGKRAASRPKRYSNDGPAGPEKRQRRQQQLVPSSAHLAGLPSFSGHLSRSFSLKIDQTVAPVDEYIASDTSEGFLSFCDTESVMSEWLSSDDAFSEGGLESEEERDSPVDHRASLESPTPMDPLPGLSDEASPLAAWINSTENDASLALPVDDYLNRSKLQRVRTALADHTTLMAF